MRTQIPGDGYTGDDSPYQWLLVELETMSAPARKDFLKFVTARVRLPSGGLRALSRKVIDYLTQFSYAFDEPDSCASNSHENSHFSLLSCSQIEIRRSPDVSCVPHGHTCSMALDLPPYRTQTELHVMLYKALDLMNNFDTILKL